ncbi:hypothetical protein RB595_006524 [Gaeumannomyces hyphopodioides]
MASAVAKPSKPLAWADDDDVDEGTPTTTDRLPDPQTIVNKDGTKTIISWRYNDMNQKVKTTRRVRLTTHREVVSPRVADRKTWGKFGLSAKDTAGPAHDTTSVGENIIFRPSANWRKEAKDDSKDPNANAMKDKLKDKKVKCRICNGEHFTARCPYKDTMAPVGEAAPGGPGAGADLGPGDDMGGGAGGAGAGKKGSYVPPALRNGGKEGEKMGGAGGKYGERDDLATLRVTNVSSPYPYPYPQDGGERRKRRRRRRRLRELLANTAHATNNRSRRWQRSKSCAICSSGSAVSPESSWPRTATRAWPRASPLSASPTGTTPSRRATRWTAGVSSISSSGSSSPRRPLEESSLFSCLLHCASSAPTPLLFSFFFCLPGVSARPLSLQGGPHPPAARMLLHRGRWSGLGCEGVAAPRTHVYQIQNR